MKNSSIKIDNNENKHTKSYYHGGLDKDFSLDKLDVFRTSVKQQKKGRDYSGFYLYDESNLNWAMKYGPDINKSLHRFDIEINTKILKLGNIERMKKEKLMEYLNSGYDLIEGIDVRGLHEYILLNKSIVKNVESIETIKDLNSSINDKFIQGLKNSVYTKNELTDIDKIICNHNHHKQKINYSKENNHNR